MRNLLFICFVLLFASCSSEQKKKDETATIKVASVELSENDAKREFPFISKPFQTTDLSFRVGGPVTQFDVQSGNFYKKGAIIASIDNRDYIIKKEKAQALYENAKSEFKRIAALYEKKNISGSNYEKAKSDLAIAKAAFDVSVNELNDTQLVAPFDGYVQTVAIERFQDVRPSQTIVSFIDLSKLKIEAYIPENIAVAVNKITNIELHFDALADVTYNASVLDVSKSTTSNNLSFFLTASYRNADNLLAGMSGTLSLSLQREDSSRVVIPQVAISHRPTVKSFVWVVDDTGKVEYRPVVVGALVRDNKIEIISGLKAGERVAVTSLSLLSDNVVVKIAE